MYFFYLDESGHRNPKERRDEPFVLTAVGLWEGKWRHLDASINKVKRKLILNIKNRDGVQLELADAEVHSSPIRISKMRNKHKFLGRLTDDELMELVNTYYQQLLIQNCRIFTVIIDKTKLFDYIDEEKLIRKAYEMILERIETFLTCEHPRHNGICIVDNTTKQLNRSLAMKHIYFQAKGTSAGVKLWHIIEEPLFVASELCNGVQLADLCAYNIFHVFNYQKPDYPYFKRILPYIYYCQYGKEKRLEGLKIFPDESSYFDLVKNIT